MTFKKIDGRDWYEIEVSFDEPEVVKYSDGTELYQIMHNSGHWFEFKLPFRRMIAVIQNRLESQFNELSITIPSWESEMEDFVEFELSNHQIKIDGYYEYSLGYISLYLKDLEIAKTIRHLLNGLQFCSIENDCDELQ